MITPRDGCPFVHPHLDHKFNRSATNFYAPANAEQILVYLEAAAPFPNDASFNCLCRVSQLLESTGLSILI